MPGLNGFIGEFPILLGMYRFRPTTAVFATLGMILGAYYLLWMLQRLVFGPLREPAVFDDATGTTPVARSPFGPIELAGIAPLVVLIAVIGLFPAPFVDRIKPPLAPIVARLQPVGAADRPVAIRDAARTVPATAAVVARPAAPGH